MTAPLSCDHCEELLADHLLHALELEAVSTVMEHLSICERCRVQLAAYEAVLDQLAQAIPQQAPPTELGSRLLKAAIKRSTLTASAPEPLYPRRRPNWRSGRAFLLTAANIVLCLSVGWWAWHVQREAALVRQRWQDVQRYLTLQHQAFMLITAPEARPVILRSDKADSQAHGILLLKPEESNAVLIVQDLPPLQRDRAYQLWLGGATASGTMGGVSRR